MSSSTSTAMPLPLSPRTPVPPWYRQRWPWLLMAGPAIVVAASMVTLWLAATTDDAVVADDYYKRGLSINERLQRVERASALGIAAEVHIAADGRVRVALTSSSQAPEARPAVVVLAVAHATRGGSDRRAELVLGPEGSYDGNIEPVGPGRWLVSLETQSWRLPAVAIAGDVRTLTMRAASMPTSQ